MAEKPIPSPESAKSLRAKFLQAALRRKSARGMYGANGKGMNLEGATPEQGQLQLAAPKNGAQVQDAWEDHSAQIRNVYLTELFESAPEAISLLDSSYRVVRVNAEFARMFGYSNDEAVGQRLEDLIVPASRLHESRWLADATDKGQKVTLKTRRRRKDGGLVEVSVLAMPVKVEGAPVAVYGIYHDIGESQRAEALQSALYRIAEKTSSAGDLNDFFAAIHNIVGELMYAKNFYIALYDPATRLLSFDYFVDEEDPPFPPKPLGKGLTEYVLRTGEPLLASPDIFEGLVRRGEVQSIGAPSLDWLGVPLKAGDNTFGVLVVQSYNEKVRYGEKEKEILNFVSQHVASAIEHKRHQEALRCSEARYRSLVQSAAYGIFRSSLDGKFLDVNPALIGMLGYESAEEVLVLDPRNDVFLHAHEQVRLVEEYERSGRVDNVELKWKRRDGKPITVRLSGRGVSHDDGGKVLEIFAEDVTERRALEEQFRQSQKMEAVGRLAGGVAHDFNNLMAVISGYTDVLLKEFDQQNPLRTNLEAIRAATDRAASLTRQLLAFGRKQVLELKTISLNSVLEDVGRLLGPLLGENVHLVTRPAPDLGLSKADAGQIEQVIMNLAVNARDAMSSGGTLIIETANVELDDPYRRGHFTLAPGPYVMLAISDTGSGMDAETQSRIFEPFFTTKEKGKGTGLGLSTVYGIVKQSGGHIFVYSEEGRGTTFKIYFPRVEEAQSSSARSLSNTRYAGSENVLVVEDEESVRELVLATLKRHGYTVLEASNGDEALDMVQQCGQPIHMMISDVVMPGLGGRELAKKVGALHPDMKVLFVSGYTEDAIQHHGVLDAGTTFLQKPFTLDALARKVREVLDSKSNQQL